jgi:hypothetical protein
VTALFVIQKANLRVDYSNLNKFRVRLATKKEASLAKLPPCEATFHQHVLRAYGLSWFKSNDRTTSLSNYKMTIVDLSRHYMADNFVHNNKAL